MFRNKLNKLNIQKDILYREKIDIEVLLTSNNKINENIVEYNKEINELNKTKKKI